MLPDFSVADYLVADYLVTPLPNYIINPMPDYPATGLFCYWIIPLLDAAFTELLSCYYIIHVTPLADYVITPMPDFPVTGLSHNLITI